MGNVEPLVIGLVALWCLGTAVSLWKLRRHRFRAIAIAAVLPVALVGFCLCSLGTGSIGVTVDVPEGTTDADLNTAVAESTADANLSRLLRREGLEDVFSPSEVRGLVHVKTGCDCPACPQLELRTDGRTWRHKVEAMFGLAPVLADDVGARLRCQKARSGKMGDAGGLGLPAMTQLQLEAASPVVDGFARALADMAPGHPELAGYRVEKARWTATDAIGVWYEHNFKDPGARRGIEPLDFGEHGFYVRFRCATIPAPDGPVPTMIVPDRELANLGLYVWTHTGASAEPSAGLLDKVSELLEAHAERLVEIDRKAIP